MKAIFHTSESITESSTASSDVCLINHYSSFSMMHQTRIMMYVQRHSECSVET